MDRSPFRLVLISTASVNEFNNTTSNFKNRLPIPIRLEGDWEVAMDDIGMPGATRFADKLNPDRRTLFQTRYLRRVRNPGVGDHDRPYNLAFRHADLELVTPTVGGVGFMKSVFNKFEQDRNDRTVDGLFPRLSRTVDGEEQHTFWKWKWEGDELVSDNASTYKGDVPGRPWFLVDYVLGVKMGWWYQDEDDEYHLGPNLKQELFDPNMVPEINGNPSGDVYDTDASKHVFWTTHDPIWGLQGSNADRGYVRLSYHCNWRFTNLDAAFAEAIGSSQRTLLVYSDVCTPSTVGSQKVDLLREVTYADNQDGTVYFEPHRLQHLGVRNSTLDIISVQIAEKNGDIAKFHQGTTTVTLHFNPI